MPVTKSFLETAKRKCCENRSAMRAARSAFPAHSKRGDENRRSDRHGETGKACPNRDTDVRVCETNVGNNTRYVI